MTKTDFLNLCGEAWDAAYQQPADMGGDWSWAARGSLDTGYASRDAAVMDALQGIWVMWDAAHIAEAKEMNNE